MKSYQHINLRIRSLAAALAFTACGALLVAGTIGNMRPAFAQPAPGPDQQQRGNRLGKVLLTLGLSDTQKEKIRTIMADGRAQAKAETDPQARRTKMRAAFAKVQDVLTPAQRAQLKSKMAAMRRSSPPPQ